MSHRPSCLLTENLQVVIVQVRSAQSNVAFVGLDPLITSALLVTWLEWRYTHVPHINCAKLGFAQFTNERESIPRKRLSST